MFNLSSKGEEEGRREVETKKRGRSLKRKEDRLNETVVADYKGEGLEGFACVCVKKKKSLAVL